MITKNMVRVGIKENLIRFVSNPDSVTGTVCEIGDEWFYFGNAETEKKTPTEYLAGTTSDEIVVDVFQTLNDMREQEALSDDYAYYESVIRDGLHKRPPTQKENCRMKHCPYCGYIAAVKSVHLVVTGETKYKSVCMNEFCIASRNEFLYDTPDQAVTGWNYRVTPTAAGFSIYK